MKIFEMFILQKRLENYAYKFDTTTLSSSTNISNTDFNGYTWPVSISGGTSSSPVEITLTENITTPLVLQGDLYILK